MTNQRTIVVCSECKMATCWYGLFMCDKAQSAGVVEMTIRALRKLKREHPSYWTEEAVKKYTGVGNER